MNISLIMLGAGNSTRFGLPCKKQWLRVKNDPLWLYASNNIANNYAFEKIIIASNELDYMKYFAPNFVFVKGGATRQESLKNALELIDSEYVMVSDIARPNIPKSLISKLILATKTGADCIVPVLKVSDTSTLNDEYIKREDLKLIQTPQLSKTSILKKALDSEISYTDDSSAIKAVGGKIWFIQGDQKARKLTYKNDLLSLKLKKPSKDIFVGHGYDVHKFCEGNHINLCGIEIPHEQGILAHSDGDAAIHALCDALFGAAGLGDLGEFYPDNDPKFKGIDSKKLLEDCILKIRQIGFEPVNVDITMILERPKISKLKEEMRFKIAEILNLRADKVNIKATTSEKMGFIGQKEGLGAIASVGLQYFKWHKVL